MIEKKRIINLLEEALTPDQFLVEVSVGAANQIYVEVDDRSKSVSIEDCIKLSRQVEHNLDREVEDFSLQVTSPGLDRPLRVFEQYVKNIGRPVKVKSLTGQVFKGQLVEASQEELKLEYREKRRIEGRKAKEWVTDYHVLPMDEVKETYIEVVFN